MNDEHYTHDELSERRLRLIARRRIGDSGIAQLHLTTLIFYTTVLLPGIASTVGLAWTAAPGGGGFLAVMRSLFLFLLVIVVALLPYASVAFLGPKLAAFLQDRRSYAKLKALKHKRLEHRRKRAAEGTRPSTAIAAAVGIPLTLIIGVVLYYTTDPNPEPILPLIASALPYLAWQSLTMFLIWRGLGGHRGRRLQCRRCGYAASIRSVTCPECGSDHQQVRNLALGRRFYRPWSMAIGLGILVITPIVLGWF